MDIVSLRLFIYTVLVGSVYMEVVMQSKIFRVVIYGVLLFNSVFCFAAATANTALQQDKVPQFLFVLEADHGTLQHQADGQVRLSLSVEHMQHILMFSDRPFRIARYITDTELAKYWVATGDNSFTADPPNAALLINDKLYDIELKNIAVTNDNVVFTGTTVNIEGSKATQAPDLTGAVRLFIDENLDR